MKNFLFAVIVIVSAIILSPRHVPSPERTEKKVEEKDVTFYLPPAPDPNEDEGFIYDLVYRPPAVEEKKVVVVTPIIF